METKIEPRNYQVELYNQANERNVIIKLDTGSGKTFIASMVIRDTLSSGSEKKIFVLVKNASLGAQHELYFRKYLYLTKEIGLFHGKMEGTNVDFWSKDVWSKMISQHRIIIITAKVFLDILNHNKFGLENICLLVFDEVHHMNKNDDYAQIAERINGHTGHLKILGLTACLIMNAKKCEDINWQLTEIEAKLNCKIVTTKDSIKNEFNANLRESFISYHNCQPMEFVAMFADVLKEMQDIPKELIIGEDEEDITAVEIVSTSVPKLVKDLQKLLIVLGFVPCFLMVKIYSKGVDNITTENLSASVKEQVKIFKRFCLQLQDRLQKIIVPSTTITCSDKCLKLLKLIYEVQNNENEPVVDQSLGDHTKKDPVESFIIVFVNEKIHALALHEFLVAMSGCNDSFKDIKSRFITGHNQCRFPKELNISTSKQLRTLKDFRDRKFNVLIATNVVEEGHDVPHCNVVVKFDPPTDFRSYVQSKGRARAKKGQYIIFTSDEESWKIQKIIRNFQNINKLQPPMQSINTFLESKVVDESDDEEDASSDKSLTYKSPQKLKPNEIYAPFDSDVPNININTAAGVLNRYIGRLRCNCVSDVKIRYSFEEVLHNDQVLIQASVSLPMPSPCMEKISALGCSKKKAQQMVNLEACKILHQKYNELDDSLLPHEKFREKYIDPVSSKQAQTLGTHSLPLATCLRREYQTDQKSTAEPMVVHLYTIQYRPNVFTRLGLTDVSQFTTDVSLGFLVSRPLHESISEWEFPVYLVGGTSSVRVTRSACPITGLTTDQRQVLLCGHRALFELYMDRVHNFTKNLQFDPEGSPLSLTLVFVRNGGLDLSFTAEFLTREPVSDLTSMPEKCWLGSVVRPLHRTTEFGAFVVTANHSSLTVDSLLKAPTVSYRTYFASEYPNIANRLSSSNSQKLVEVLRLTTLLSCHNKKVRDIHTSRRMQRINEAVLLPTSLLQCISLPCGLWTLLCLFPTVLIRLNQLMCVTELAALFTEPDSVSIPRSLRVNLDKCHPRLTIDRAVLQSSYQPTLHRFVSGLLPALLSRSCNDRVDLEILEIFGDSFLKLITSKFLYHYRPRAGEGCLSSERSSLVSNFNLFKLATARGLDRYFFTLQFDPRVHLLVPHFSVSTSTVASCSETRHRFTDRRTETMYKNKQLADCVEALLGAVVINYGEERALRFLLWLGLQLPFEMVDNYKTTSLREDASFGDERPTFEPVHLIVESVDSTTFQPPPTVCDRHTLNVYNSESRSALVDQSECLGPSCVETNYAQCFKSNVPEPKSLDGTGIACINLNDEEPSSLNSENPDDMRIMKPDHQEPFQSNCKNLDKILFNNLNDNVSNRLKCTMPSVICPQKMNCLETNKMDNDNEESSKLKDNKSESKASVGSKDYVTHKFDDISLMFFESSNIQEPLNRVELDRGLKHRLNNELHQNKDLSVSNCIKQEDNQASYQPSSPKRGKIDLSTPSYKSNILNCSSQKIDCSERHVNDGLDDLDQKLQLKCQPPDSSIMELLNEKETWIEEIESVLGYRFRYKYFLVQAITHPSSLKNRSFSCYQRLEFLGDSVLDYLVTSYIMINIRELRPGKVTCLRSAIVCNNTFAYLSAKFGFYKYLSFFDQKMFQLMPDVIENLLRYKLDGSYISLILSEKHKVIVKVLGDIFESICGAVYVDSDYDDVAVWNCFRPLLKEPLDKFTKRIPKNKISLMHEKFPNIKYSCDMDEFTNLIRLKAQMPDGSTVEIVERNKALCKLALAEKVLGGD